MKVDDVTREAISMIHGDDDIDVFGRMPVGGAGDPSEFDFAARDEADMTAEQAEYMFAGELDPFEPAGDEMFPLFKTALRKYQSSEKPPRLMRVDTDETYGDYVSDAVVREIDRRLTALEVAFAKHEADPLAHPHVHENDKMRPASRSDILGAAEAVSRLKSASNADEAADAMPQVPLDLPDFAQGKVRCWRDGDCVVVSVRFSAEDGTPRTATMAARPRADVDDAARWAISNGADPTTVLGALPQLAAVSTGQKLVRDVAGCALRVRNREDVLGAQDPVMLVRTGNEGTAPLAALMHVQQMADAGDNQAQREMHMMRAAAATPSGLRVAAPVLAEADRRLALGRAQLTNNKSSLLQRVSGWFK